MGAPHSAYTPCAVSRQHGGPKAGILSYSMWSSLLRRSAALGIAFGATLGPRAPGPLPAAPPAVALDSLAARRPDYRALAHALARYRALAADPTVPDFPTPERMPVRPGDSLAAAALLHARLAALGDLEGPAGAATAAQYDAELVEAVRRFQVRHGLVADGIIGAATVAELQMPLGARVAQIETAMRRVENEPVLDRGPFIVVNVPAFTLFAFDGGPTDTVAALAMKVIVGQAGRLSTPSLEEQLQYLDFQPAWNVPRSILLREIVPVLRRDSNYLRRQHMELMHGVDDVLGDTVTAAAIADLVSGRLWVRQRPGGNNPLGRVKFAMPNDSNVYLHDTPNRAVFAWARRDLSHGCIRLERARDLAVWATRGLDGWSADSVDAALAGPVFRRVALPDPIPVIVEYVTVVVMPEGSVWFVPDIYGLGDDLANGW